MAAAAPRPGLHPAFKVAAVTFAVLVAAASFRSTTGVLLQPIEDEFGWTRSQTSAAVSLNLVLYGLTAPFAAALLQRFKLRQVVASALLLVAAGSAGALFIQQSWHLLIAWGLAIGLGTGSLAIVFGAIIANRWFVSRRGLVTGVFSAASAAGQLVFLPVYAALAESAGWRWAGGITATLALLLVVPVWLVLADRPSEVGAQPFGATPDWKDPAAPALTFTGAARSTVTTLARASSSGRFWLLMWSFFVCGWSTNGLIQTHFVSAAHDHGMPATTAAGLLAFVGIFDLVGTIASGWLTDRTNPRLLLAIYYGLRGLALLSVPYVIGSEVQPPLLFFIVFYGLDWVATVPPTVQLCREGFGVEQSGVVYGWVFASHMVGAGASAAFAGWIRQSQGDYSLAWQVAALFCASAVLTSAFAPKGRARAFASPHSES